MATSSQTTTPNAAFAGLRSTQDYYERFRNANLFISNNANPFLISPYAPNQLSRTTANAILAANTIKPLTPGGTIQIQGSVNVAAPYQLSLDGNPFRTDRIYAGTSIGTPAQIICSTAPDVIVELAGTTNVVFQPDVATFENVTAPGTYSLFVSGTVSTANIAVTTAAGAAPGGAPVASLPITVGGVSYQLALY
jgi:hypothetical protein